MKDFLYEFRHYLDGFAGGTGTLQTEINQTSVIDDTGSIHQFGTAAEGCLADSKLEFIHITDDVVGLARLFYPAEVEPSAEAFLPTMRLVQANAFTTVATANATERVNFFILLLLYGLFDNAMSQVKSYHTK